MVKPFLRWAGSKKRLIPELLQFWNTDKHSGYIEPFAGSAQLFFAVNPKRAVLGDLNSELINGYNQIKINPFRIFEGLHSLKISKEQYYTLRSLDPENLSDTERAVRFIYLNRFCFNGLYRTNLNGRFNVPYAGDKTGNLPELDSLMEISKALQKVEIVNLDFYETVSLYTKKGDFVYFDPPYAVSNERIFKQYGPQTFGKYEISRLLELLVKLDIDGNNFLVSYASCDEAREVFAAWNQKTIKTQRFMKGFGKNRQYAEELLIYN